MKLAWPKGLKERSPGHLEMACYSKASLHPHRGRVGPGGNARDLRGFKTPLSGLLALPQSSWAYP